MMEWLKKKCVWLQYPEKKMLSTAAVSKTAKITHSEFRKFKFKFLHTSPLSQLHHPPQNLENNNNNKKKK